MLTSTGHRWNGGTRYARRIRCWSDLRFQLHTWSLLVCGWRLWEGGVIIMNVSVPALILWVTILSLQIAAASTTKADVNCKRSDREYTATDLDYDTRELRRKLEVVKGFSCGPLRVEFVRMDETAFAMLEKQDSKSVEAAVGSPELVQTTIVQMYRAFRDSYGTVYSGRALSEELPYQDTSNTEYHKTFPSIFEPKGNHTDVEYFPAIDEMAGLANEYWPRPLKLFVSEQLKRTSYDRIPTPTIWRSLTSEDIESASSNAPRLRAVSPELKDLSVTEHSRALRFLLELSGGVLPDELVRLEGWHSVLEDGCTTGPAAAPLSAARPRLFMFRTKMPELYIDAVLLRNTSARTIMIKGFAGVTSKGNGLRRVDQSGNDAPNVDDLAGPITLASGQSALVPTAVLLRPSEMEPCCDYIARGEPLSRQAVEEFRSAGYDVSLEDYQTPAFPLYFKVLPAYSVTGLKTSLGSMSFERTRPLRLSFNVALEEGSCPYLMSRKVAAGEEVWTDYGKVLHTADSPALKGRHVEKLAGAPTVFRIEEREPEVATIDMVRLTVTYTDGTKHSFLPSLPELQNTDGVEAKIPWGQAIEFQFRVSDSLDRRSPVSSELEIVGFYERLDFKQIIRWLQKPTRGRLGLRADLETTISMSCIRPGIKTLQSSP